MNEAFSTSALAGARTGTPTSTIYTLYLKCLNVLIVLKLKYLLVSEIMKIATIARFAELGNQEKQYFVSVADTELDTQLNLEGRFVREYD